MKRKFLVVLMTFACALCLAFGIAGCSPKKDDAPVEGSIYKCSQTEHWLESPSGEETAHSPHSVTDGVCTTCGYVEKCTEGLAFTEWTENGETTGYMVSQGTATGSRLYIPSFYNGLPVTFIRAGAFSQCRSFESVTIGNNVTYIGERAFDGCESLESITIPDSVTSIDGLAFYNTAYYNNPENWDNDVLYIGNCLVEAKDTLSGSYEIKDGTKLLANFAFADCTSLTSITVPDSLKYICEGAFSACNITNVIFGDNSQLVSIGSSAFIGCPIENLTVPGNVSQIDITAFTCNVNVSENNKRYSSLDGVLYNKDKTELIKVPLAKTSVTIPDSVTTIGGYAFRNCTSLTSITIPDSVTEIVGNAFVGCTSLTEITIPNSVTSIGDNAFFGCGNLTSVTIGNGVTSIGSGAFEVCTSLESVTIGNSVTTIGERAFKYCTSLTSINIPNSVTSIGVSAFQLCTSLTEITIPKSVTEIGESAFGLCESLESITVEDGNTEYLSQDGVLYNKDKTEIIKVTQTKTSITIPDSVTSIGNYAFSGCTNLTEITIPDNVISIGRNAFYECKSLTNVNFGDNSQLTFIDSGAFSFCNLTNITIPDGVTEIGWNTFYGCTSLESVTIGNGVTSIGGGAFQLCTSLKNITIPISVTEIGEGAFNGCTGLINITLPASITEIGGNAFYGCTSLTEITIPNSVTEIGYGAFNGCTSLESVTFENPDGWTANGTDIPSASLNNHATAASYLKETYSNCSWERKTA